MDSVRANEWRAYRSAFDHFSRVAREAWLRIHDPDQDQESVIATLLELEKAHVEYDARRDALAQSLLPETTLPQSWPEHESRVRPIAELLWESAGRPEGTADRDWQLAEEIVREAGFAMHG